MFRDARAWFKSQGLVFPSSKFFGDFISVLLCFSNPKIPRQILAASELDRTIYTILSSKTALF
jgi:hypothetical protein